jgi:hypothetical protein
MKIVLETVTKIRSLRPATDKNERRAVLAVCRTTQAEDLIQSYDFLITTLASLSSIKVLLFFGSLLEFVWLCKYHTLFLFICGLNSKLLCRF